MIKHGDTRIENEMKDTESMWANNPRKQSLREQALSREVYIHLPLEGIKVYSKPSGEIIVKQGGEEFKSSLEANIVAEAFLSGKEITKDQYGK